MLVGFDHEFDTVLQEQEDVHVVDIAQVVSEISRAEQVKLFLVLDRAQAAEVLQRLDECTLHELLPPTRPPLFWGPRWRRTPRNRACRALFLARLGSAAASMSAARNQRLPLRVRLDLCLSALSLLPGQRAGQLARWAAVGNALMSTPTSAMITSAVGRLMPGMLFSRVS